MPLDKPMPQDIIWQDQLPQQPQGLPTPQQEALQPSISLPSGQQIYDTVKPTVDLAGMMAGGIAGGSVGGPPGAVALAGLGYAGTRNLTEGIGGLLGYTPQQSTTEALKNTLPDIKTGALSEMTGQIIPVIYAGAQNQLGKLAKKLYESSLKPVPSLPADLRNSAIQTGFERAAAGKSYRPSDKHLANLFQDTKDLISQADNMVTQADDNGMISLKQLANSIDEVGTRFRQGPFPKSDISKLAGLKNQLLSKYGITDPINTANIPAQYDKLIPATEALATKKFIYQMADKYYNNPNVNVAPVKIEAEKAVAHAIKMELENLYPATKTLNEEAGKLIDFGKVLERATQRTGNRELFNIFEFLGGGVGATIAGAPGAIGGGFISYTVSNPQFKSLMAKQIYKASIPNIVKVQVLSQLGRMGYVEAMKRTLPPPATIIPHRQNIPDPIGVQ